MKFKERILTTHFLKRQNRFVGTAKGKNGVIPIHIPNTGSLRGVLCPPQPCRIRHFKGAKRKLPYSLEMLKAQNAWVGVNTHLPNRLVQEAWEQKRVWTRFPFSQGEVTVSPSCRIDRVFWKDPGLSKFNSSALKSHSLHFVEIKNVSLKEETTALFPDSPTLRGKKHLKELMALMNQGHTCEMVYVAQREDCTNFSPADHIDREYGILLRKAVDQGLKISVFPCRLTASSVTLLPRPLPVKL